MTTVAAKIQRSLSRQIITGDLQPGQKLEEKTLARQFGVSRTPIREALRELGARGLIDLIPRRGGVVAIIGIERLADMLDAECELEALCAQLASQRMTAIEKGQLQDLHDQSRALAAGEDEADYLLLNYRFHDLICGGAHNSTLGATTRELRDRLAPFRQSQGDVQPRRLARSHEEHGVIVDAIVRSDAEAAYKAMRYHNARLSVGVLSLLRPRDPEAGGGAPA